MNKEKNSNNINKNNSNRGFALPLSSSKPPMPPVKPPKKQENKG